MSIGERLKEERKRLGLSQTEFAEKLGMHRNSQSRYESGEREPEASYLRALGEIGCDVGFVMTGVRDEENDLYNETLNRLFVTLCTRLGVDHDRRERLILEAFEIEKSTLHLEYGHEVAVNKINALVAQLIFEKISDFDLIDLSVLSAIFEGIDSVQTRLNLSISSMKKACAAITLYRTFKAHGKVDSKTIEEVVKLAAQSAA